MFSNAGNTDWLVERLSDIWVSRKSTMAAITGSINEITYISASIHEKQQDLDGFTHVFEVGQHEETNKKTVRRPNLSEIEDGGH